MAPYHHNFHQQPRYIPLSQPMPLLANTPFIVTGSGNFFVTSSSDPAANLGIVKVDSDGAGYHILWGSPANRSHFQLPAHFLPTASALKPPTAKIRVIMGCHATNLIALTYVLENDTAVFTRQLWEGSTECLVVFPDGVGICGGWYPARTKSARRPHRDAKTFAVLWPFQASSAAVRRWMKHLV
ncbi:hypothetical protein ACNKHV_24805 [Shigella flexneri]